MNKSLLIVVIIFIFLSACGKQKNEVEIIKNYDAEYYTLDQVDVEPATDDQMKTLNEDLKKITSEFIGDLSLSSELYYNYRIYLNENGKVDAIKELPIDEEINYERERLTELFSKAASGWELSPAIKDNKPVKFRSDIELIAYKDEDGDIKIDIPSLRALGGSLTSFGKTLADFSDKNYLVNVDEMPVPVGGMEAIGGKVVYPEKAKKEGIEGKVFLKVYIDENGDVVLTEVIKGVEELNEAALKAIEAAKFEPGKQNGKPVKTQVSIPIVFKLK